MVYRKLCNTTGELSNLSTNGHEQFHSEKDEIVRVTSLGHDAWKTYMKDHGLTDRSPGIGPFPRLGEVIEKAFPVLPCGLSKVIV